MMADYSIERLRRYRASESMREIFADVRLGVADFIAPIFVTSGAGVREEISSMPGQFRFSADTAVETARRWFDKGIRAVLLFGIPQEKDATGRIAYDDAGPVQVLTRELKKSLPELVVMTDVCLCDYTDHGHCGILHESSGGEVDNDLTLDVLSRIAISHARCGADVVAPSAMMDGQVRAIRVGLDEAALAETMIMSYSVKFASCFYGPFRDAADCAPKFGDRKSYQMDYRDRWQAVREAEADVAEGADIIMVKPAGAYLDIVRNLAERFDVPLAAYQVSGEYSSIKLAAERGLFDEREAVMESVTAIKRAGAGLIITYFSEQLAEWLNG